MQEGKSYLFLNTNFEEGHTGRKRCSSSGLCNPPAYFRVWPANLISINLSKIYTFFKNVKIHLQSPQFVLSECNVVYDIIFWSVRPILPFTSKSFEFVSAFVPYISQIFLVFLFYHAFCTYVQSSSFLLSYLALVRVVGNYIWTRSSPTAYKFRLLPLQ